MEIIVVDNASTDGSPEFIRNNYPNVIVINNEINLGFSEGNNIGIRKSKGEIVILLNNDTRVDPFWVKELIRAGMGHNIGVIGCQLYIGDSDHFQQSGYLMHSSGRGVNVLESISQDCGSPVVECDWVNGAAFAFKRVVLERIGLLDPLLTPDHEDKDIGWRAIKAGYRVVLARRAKVRHYVSQSWRYMPIRRVYLSEKNRIMFAFKHFSGRNLFRALTYSQISLWVRPAVYFLRGRTVVQKVRKVRNLENNESFGINMRNTVMLNASHILLCLLLTSIWPIYQLITSRNFKFFNRLCNRSQISDVISNSLVKN